MHNAQCKMHNCGIFLAENAFKINFCLSYQPSSYIIVGADDHIRPLRVRSLSAAYGTMWSSSPTSGGALNRNLRYRIIIFNSQFSIFHYNAKQKEAIGVIPMASQSVKKRILTDWQRSKNPSRQATRPRSVCGYSSGERCAVSQNALRSKPFFNPSVFCCTKIQLPLHKGAGVTSILK